MGILYHISSHNLSIKSTFSDLRWVNPVNIFTFSNDFQTRKREVKKIKNKCADLVVAIKIKQIVEGLQ